MTPRPDDAVPTPGGLFTPGAPDPETADLLRQVLHRQADAVRPSPDGLERILAAARTGLPAAVPDHDDVPGPDGLRHTGHTAEVTVRPLVPRQKPRRTLFARWMPAVAAAAVVTVLAGGLGAVRLGVIRAPMLAAVVGTSQRARSTGPAAVPALPVYLLEQEQGRWALVREFVPTTEADPGRRLTAALRLAVAGTSSDPDLTSAWAALHLAGDVQGELTAAGITVRLSESLLADSAGGDPQPAPASTMTRFALQQLVWTATAVVGKDSPVQVEGPSQTSVLFQAQPLERVFTRDTGATDPRAPVWVNSIVDGQHLQQGTATVSGDATTTATGTVDWTLGFVGGATVTAGTAALLRDNGTIPAVGERGTFRLPLSLPAPGTYQLSVTQDWPSASDPSATWTDTVTLVVR